jgi:hypothetical protein
VRWNTPIVRAYCLQESFQLFWEYRQPKRAQRLFTQGDELGHAFAAVALQEIRPHAPLPSAWNLTLEQTIFPPTSGFRRRMQSTIATKPRRSFALTWTLAAALSLVVVAGLLSTYLGAQRSHPAQSYSEIADLHVGTLASSSQVDVVSSDRHTVKPWFQGKIHFAFDLPELQNSEFSLSGAG